MRAGQQYQRIPEDELVGRGLELGYVPQAGEAELPSLFSHRQRTSSSSLGSAAEDPSIAPTATAYDSTLLSRTTPLRAPASGASGSRGASTSLWCGFFVLVVAVTGALLSMFKLTMDLQSQVVLYECSPSLGLDESVEDSQQLPISCSHPRKITDLVHLLSQMRKAATRSHVGNSMSEPEAVRRFWECGV